MRSKFNKVLRLSNVKHFGKKVSKKGMAIKYSSTKYHKIFFSIIHIKMNISKKPEMAR